MRAIVFAILLIFTVDSNAMNEKNNIDPYLKSIDYTINNPNVNLIDCLYIINLDRRPERWQKANQAFLSFDIHPTRFSAINGWSFSEEEMQKLMGLYPLRLSGGHFGCILSHLSILKHASVNDYNYIWVCEDDIIILEDPHQISDFVLKLTRISPYWDVIYTDREFKNKDGEIIFSVSHDFRPDLPHADVTFYRRKIKFTEDFYEIGQRFGTHSMIISKQGINKILKFYRENGIWASYDVDIHYIPGISEYSLSRDIVSQDITSESDIDK